MESDSRMARIRAIENGSGIRHILDAGRAVLGNPILTHDHDYKVISYTENRATDDPIWNEFAADGKVGAARLQFYKDECFFELAANAKNVTLLTSDALKYDRYFGKLFSEDGVMAGCACIVGCERPFEPGDPELFEALCEKINAELNASVFYRNYGRVAMESLINRMIDGDIQDRELLISHIENIYIGLGSGIYLAAASFDGVCEYAAAAAIRDELIGLCPSFKYAVHGPHVLILASTDAEETEARALFRELYPRLSAQDCRAGVSGRFENLLELPGRYREAEEALSRGAGLCIPDEAR